MINIILFGPPGSGKGTQSKFLEEKFSLVHLSTGDICRNEIDNKTPEGVEAKRLIDGGNFFPDELAYKMLEKFLDKNNDSLGFIYDGIPRHVGQVPVFADILKNRKAKVDYVIELNLDDDKLIERLLLRGKSSGRKDDGSREIIQKRLNIYKDVTKPIACMYADQGIYHEINGEGSMQEVFSRICDIIKL